QNSQDVSILLGDGRGGFRNVFTEPAGGAATGLAVRDINGDGRQDLLVGGDFGDLLILLGNGNGTFQPATGRTVPFVTGHFNVDWMKDVLLTDAARARVAVMLRQPGTDSFVPGGFIRAATDGLIAPVAPLLADLNGDGILDMMVANSGSNSVTVYLPRAD